jgi:hypothetical protein
MIFEVVNPSDPIEMECNDLKVAQVACLLQSHGYYGLRNEAGEIVLPPLVFGGFKGWIKENFESLENFYQFQEDHGKEIIEALKSYRIKGGKERSSLNDICSQAHLLAQAIQEKISKQGNKNE